MNPLSLHLRYLVLATANVLAGLLGLFVLTMVSSRFGTVGLGDVALATALLTYATVAATGGTELFAIKSVAANPQKLGQMISAVIVVRLLLGGVCYAGLLSIAFWVYPDRSAIIALFGLALLPAALMTSWVPQALHRSGVFALVNVSTQAISVGLLWVALQAGYGLPAVAITKVLADGLIVLGLLLWLRQSGYTIERVPDWKTLRRLVIDCLPIAGTQLVRMIGLGSDLIILAFFVSREEIGLFAASFKIYGFILGLATAYFVILLPRIAQQRDNAAMSHELKASFRRVLPLALLVSGVIALTSATMLSLLFGQAFVTAALSLQILCLAWLANVGHRHYRQVLVARGLHGVDFRQSAMACAVHLGARFALVPWLGITGAALGMLIGELFLLFVQRQAAIRELR